MVPPGDTETVMFESRLLYFLSIREMPRSSVMETVGMIRLCLSMLLARLISQSA